MSQPDQYMIDSDLQLKKSLSKKNPIQIWNTDTPSASIIEWATALR